MALKERLQEDWKKALKAKDKFRADTISTARAAVLMAEKNQGATSVDDEAIIEILAREVKQRREAITEFEKGNRQDLIDKANAEIEILLSYLPQQLSEDEIYEIVRVTATEVGANSMKDMGRLMAAVIDRTKGRADGKVVSTIVKEHLSK
ncbi:MAG: GatB/YqeY domain-containing protein [Clostridiales bacterium]|jgi:uncharacterized protein YqeY|nr:GatB/YqeY domain-containing protein [Clostridia bacterium]NLZ47296.1 GatB/YqeY domain-containing protein [Clostridiales bacterium]